MKHGAAWTYNHHKCRCELCTAAGTAAQGKARRKRYSEREWVFTTHVQGCTGEDCLWTCTRALVATKSPRHGTATIYRNWGCRCDDCTEAHADSVGHQRKGRAG